MLKTLDMIRRHATHRLHRRLGLALKRFGDDRRAVAAFEFSLVVTVLLLILLGICDVVPSWLVSNNVNNAASTAGDVAAQFSEMQTSDMVNVYSAAADVMSPFSATNQSLRITHLSADLQQQQFRGRLQCQLYQSGRALHNFNVFKPAVVRDLSIILL